MRRKKRVRRKRGVRIMRRVMSGKKGEKDDGRK